MHLRGVVPRAPGAVEDSPRRDVSIRVRVQEPRRAGPLHGGSLRGHHRQLRGECVLPYLEPPAWPGQRSRDFRGRSVTPEPGPYLTQRRGHLIRDGGPAGPVAEGPLSPSTPDHSRGPHTLRLKSKDSSGINSAKASEIPAFPSSEIRLSWRSFILGAFLAQRPSWRTRED